ncbi:MAG: isoprenylcysteine carboxylmethyltransferase family protein [Anaerolineae bacterium]|nr:isoprenylcysteine carboxylmethyltransferase family protein [Anaerolineae bacterium]
MSTNAAHKRKWQIFEVIVGVPFLAGIGLQLAAPVARPNGLVALVIVLVGAVLIALGLTLIVLARRELAQHGQPTDPGLPTSKLVTRGIFSVSRNPIYLGGVCLLAGIALALNLLWSLVLLLPAIVACHYLLITPEERYLAAKFDTEYAKYAAAVHRWFGRVRG